MQYLIRINGKVVNQYDKTYVIRASSQEKAREIVKNDFTEKNSIIDEEIYVSPLDNSKRGLAACILLLIPVLLSFVDWKIGHDTVSIRPTYQSCLYAVILYAAMIVRFKGILKAFNSWIDVLFCIIIVLLMSSFIQTLIVSKEVNLLGIRINTNMLLPITMGASWLGIRFVSVICIGCMGAFALVNICALSNAMGSVFGPIYIISSFLGTCCYLSIEPAFLEAFPYFGKKLNKGMRNFNDDIEDVKRAARHLDDRLIRIREKRESEIENIEADKTEK